MPRAFPACALRRFRYRANLAQTGPPARERRRGRGELPGERYIRANGKVGTPDGKWAYLVLAFACVLALAGCGLGGGDTTPSPTPAPAASSPPTAETTDAGLGQAETTKDVPFNLNTDQPVPADFEEAYGRGARIVVQFYKLNEDSLAYPQGLDVDRQVNQPR